MTKGFNSNNTEGSFKEPGKSYRAGRVGSSTKSTENKTEDIDTNIVKEFGDLQYAKPGFYIRKAS